MTLGREVQEPRGAQDLDPLTDGDSETFPLVDENEICLESQAQRDGGAFAGIETVQSWVIRVTSLDHSQPSPGRLDPSPNGWRRRRIRKLTGHFHWNDDDREQVTKKIDLTHQNQIPDRAGLRHNEQHR
jgi:hypothetical protein